MLKYKNMTTVAKIMKIKSGKRQRDKCRVKSCKIESDRYQPCSKKTASNTVFSLSLLSINSQRGKRSNGRQEQGRNPAETRRRRKGGAAVGTI